MTSTTVSKVVTFLRGRKGMNAVFVIYSAVSIVYLLLRWFRPDLLSQTMPVFGTIGVGFFAVFMVYRYLEFRRSKIVT